MYYNQNYNLSDIIYFCEIDQIEKVEQWLPVVGYERIYEVSDLGRVKSLSRLIIRKTTGNYVTKEKIIRTGKDSTKRFTALLSDNGIKKPKKTYVLVAESFLGHIVSGYDLIVDHIDNDLDNNKLSNLQIISQRKNASKDRKNKTSSYTGVCWDKTKKRWIAQIKIHGNKIHLGTFKIEEYAKIAYEKALKPYL